MGIAAIYDIHGNLPAFTAVLGEVAQAKVELVVVGGWRNNLKPSS